MAAARRPFSWVEPTVGRLLSAAIGGNAPVEPTVGRLLFTPIDGDGLVEPTVGRLLSTPIDGDGQPQPTNGRLYRGQTSSASRVSMSRRISLIRAADGPTKVIS